MRRTSVVAVGVILVLFAGGLMYGTASAAGAKATVVLDPDDQFAFTIRDGVRYEAFPIQYAIAQGVAAKLPDVCNADVSLTRSASQTDLSRSVRATRMQAADVSATLSLNSFHGFPWGTEAEGGSGVFATSAPDNLAFGNELLSQLGGFTGRPTYPINETPTLEDLELPYPEFAALPNTYAHAFLLYIDHNFDWFVVSTPEGQQALADAVVTAIATTLQAKGFQCLGKFPSRPSAATFQRWRNFGYQSFLRYGADPVSMSTGNFTTSERIFTLSGVGSQQIDLTPTYNAQSNQDSPVGVGWTFAYASFVQQYSDGSVAVNMADGRAFLFEPDGSGGFTTPSGAFASLAQPDATTIRWTSTTGSGMSFTLDGAGRGALQSVTDRQGNATTLHYGGTGAVFPKLTEIVDHAGQHIAVATNDDGRITGFTRPDGATWQLGYSSAGELTSITTARGTVRKFGYDGLHRMTSETGQDGVTFLTNEYDADSRVVRQTNAFGQERTIVYDDANHKTTYTDTTGAETVYHWNALGAVTEVEDALGGTTETGYNADLQPTTEINPLGHTVTTDYDPTGQPASVTDPLGNKVSATYNTTGDLTSRSDEGGAGGSPRTTTFSLNGDGLPTTITNPDGTTQTRTYNDFGDVLTSTDELGHTTKYDYDGRGNTVGVTDPLGHTSTMTYDLANRLTSVTDPRGHTTTYAYDANDNLLRIDYPDGSNERRTYDVNDQLETSTDRRGAVTTYTYDLELNVVEITLPNGGVIKNTFDGEDRLTSTTDPLGNKTTYTLDALGRRVATTDALGHTTETTFDAAGRVEAEADASGAATTFVRDANGRVLKAIDPAGGVTTNEWDEVGRLTKVTDQLGHETSYIHNFRDQVTTITDPIGGVLENVYDDAGRLTSTTDQVGAVTTYEFDARNQVVKVTDALGGVTTMAYDPVGNQTSVTDGNGHTTTTGYDEMNQVVARTDGNGHTTTFVRDGGGLLVDEIDPLGHHTKRAYDSLAKPTAITDPLGRTTKMGYDLNSRQTSETAADGVVTKYEPDEVGNLATVIQNWKPGQPSTESVNVTTRGAYDARNLLTAITDANGAVTTFGYDVRHLLSSETDPLGNVTTYEHDKAGNPSSRTDGNGATTTYEHDPRNLLTRRAYPGGIEETFSYDAVGRQRTATNAMGTVTTTYDLLGRTTKVTDAVGKTLKPFYDAVGNRVAMTLPDGRNLGYAYDNADQLTRLDSPLGTVNVQYDAAGRPTLLTRPNGAQTTSQFDNANQLTLLKTTAGSDVLAAFAYTYDQIGNVSTRGQTVGKATTSTTYAYDPLRRLTSSGGGPLPSTYSYDAVGNRLTWNAPDDPLTPKPNDPFTQTNVFNAAGQLTKSTMVRSNGNATFTDVTTNRYDKNGNRTETTTVAQAPGQSHATAYAFDFEDRLRSSVPTGERDERGNGAGQRNYTRTYDALGRLVTETRGAEVTTWTHDGLNPILAEDADTTLYLRGISGRLLGEQVDTDDPEWYLADALGSVLGTVDSKLKLDDTASYSDYGVRLDRTSLRVGFDGELSDPTLPGNGIGNDTPVLSHYYARGYDPMSGNWLQEDPIAGRLSEPSSLAPHQFVAGNPSTNSDALGYLTLSVGNYSYTGSLSVSDYTPTGSLSLASTTPTPTLSVRDSDGSVSSLYQGSVTSLSVLQPAASVGVLQPALGADFLQPALSGYTRRSPASKYRAASTTSWSLQGGAIDLLTLQKLAASSSTQPRPRTSVPNSSDFPKAVDSGGLVISNAVGMKPSFWGGSLSEQLLRHYYIGGGSAVTIDWSFLSSHSAFTSAIQKLPINTPTVYSTPSSDFDMAHSLHDFTVTRMSTNCYSVRDYYDFNPNAGLVPRLFNLDAKVGVANEFFVSSQGCLP